MPLAVCELLTVSEDLIKSCEQGQLCGQRRGDKKTRAEIARYQTRTFALLVAECEVPNEGAFQEKYPEVVHLSEGASSSCMGIRSPRQPGFELIIVWRIQIDEEGKVLPKLDLLTQVPLQALELDKNRVVETAPFSFRTLLGVLGIEATLESLIKSLCTEEN
ncbi:hypothetical protein CB1_001297002 [Camelus ferus]|nr:hypothetical protein CB1_001297002 [Camelus ferus]